jgi:hypothetical protein
LPHQSIDDRPGMQQIGVGSEECRPSVLWVCTRYVLRDGQVGPRGRYQGTGSIGQHQRQMKLAASMAPTEYIERRSFKRMARPNDGYLIGKTIKMMAAVVGSLSCALSTRSATIGWYGSSNIELAIPGSFA